MKKNVKRVNAGADRATLIDETIDKLTEKYLSLSASEKPTWLRGWVNKMEAAGRKKQIALASEAIRAAAEFIVDSQNLASSPSSSTNPTPITRDLVNKKQKAGQGPLKAKQTVISNSLKSKTAIPSSSNFGANNLDAYQDEATSLMAMFKGLRGDAKAEFIEKLRVELDSQQVDYSDCDNELEFVNRAAYARVFNGGESEVKAKAVKGGSRRGQRAPQGRFPFGRMGLPSRGNDPFSLLGFGGLEELFGGLGSMFGGGGAKPGNFHRTITVIRDPNGKTRVIRQSGGPKSQQQPADEDDGQGGDEGAEGEGEDFDFDPFGGALKGLLGNLGFRDDGEEQPNVKVQAAAEAREIQENNAKEKAAAKEAEEYGALVNSDWGESNNELNIVINGLKQKRDLNALKFLKNSLEDQKMRAIITTAAQKGAAVAEEELGFDNKAKYIIQRLKEMGALPY
eukprot:GHVN01023939.1.p1 GENE.GHVN01023939.1~~GHVN01023939.1.p1  ORF type:complete len:522 (-),score=99.95 GHVN01023939.1:90-1448(-)